MVLTAPDRRSSSRPGGRFTLLVGYGFCLAGFLVMLLFWDEGVSYWLVGLAYTLVGGGVGFAGTPASHLLTGSVPVDRAAWRRVRRTSSGTWAGRLCNRSWARS